MGAKGGSVQVRQRIVPRIYVCMPPGRRDVGIMEGLEGLEGFRGVHD